MSIITVVNVLFLFVSSLCKVNSFFSRYVTARRNHDLSKSQLCMNVATIEPAVNLDALRYEAMSYFISDDKKENIKFTPTSGGVNNYMDYVTLLNENPNQPKYVLRVYNNGLNTKRVEFEHMVLDEIVKVMTDTKTVLTFDLPIAMKSIKTNNLNSKNGITHVVLSNKAEASLFKYIPGQLPKKTCVKQIGQAAGQLITIMGQININSFPASPNPAYYDIYRAHHAISQEKFYNELKKPVFTQQNDNTKKYMNLLVDELRSIEKFIAQVQSMSPPLPIQLIHGDLHYDNVLAYPEENKVTGLLDFEFCAFDWRGVYCVHVLILYLCIVFVSMYSINNI